MGSALSSGRGHTGASLLHNAPSNVSGPMLKIAKFSGRTGMFEPVPNAIVPRPQICSA